MRVFPIVHFLSTSPAWGTTRSRTDSRRSIFFLSTSPAWGTTHFGAMAHPDERAFYPRPPRGGRRAHVPHDFAAILAFLSTSPAWGTTIFPILSIGRCFDFLSTSPAWGTTVSCVSSSTDQRLSIHVPRVGDDAIMPSTSLHWFSFLSTSPAWGTTLAFLHGSLAVTLSIHVPRVGDDRPHARG